MKSMGNHTLLNLCLSKHLYNITYKGGINNVV